MPGQASLPGGPGARRLPQRKPTVFMSGTTRPPQEGSLEYIEKPNKNERILSTLNHAIQTVDLANTLVPLDLAKGILGTISALLSLIKTTIQNKEDFIGIAERCDKISMMLWRVTSGKAIDDINPIIGNAIAELNSSVDGILVALQKKSEDNVGSQAFHAVVNQEQIAEWQTDLDHSLTLFSAEVNLASNVKMDELMAKFDELRDRMSVRSTNDVVVSIPVPPRPAIFVGREDIVQEAIQNLIQRKHVALLGPGGMGKTFIARAILNDPLTISTFGQRRYFARYDDIDGSQITHGTFINRLATSIGLAGIRGKAIALIQLTLSSTEPTLIIFDNAETFLDAEKDGGAIADSINEIGALPHVVVLMTSRSTILPPNLVWNRVRVPSLDSMPASNLFHQIYTKEIDPAALDNLLKSVDHHPLSINLLAQVAVQNEWTQGELVSAWDDQRAKLLDTGSGKLQSLSATISLSLKSPSLLKYQDVVSKLLPVIAFLPQGLNRKTLQDTYPTEPQLQLVVELLCKHSLTFIKGNFVTMLAPIRLHFNKDFEQIVDLPLLDATYQFYSRKLAEDPVDADWLHVEDTNIEHLYSTILQKAICVERHQRDALHRGRHSQIERKRTLLGLVNVNSHLRRRRTILVKGACLLELGLLAYSLGTLEDARKLFLEARQLYQQTYLVPDKIFLGLTLGVAGTHITLGDFPESQRVLEADFGGINMRWRPWNRGGLDWIVPLMLHFIKVAGGHSTDATLLLRHAKNVRHGSKGMWATSMSMTMMAARLLGVVEEAKAMSNFILEDAESRFEGHATIADFCLYDGDAKRAEILLEEAPPTASDAVDCIIQYYQLLAICKFLVGKPDEAASIPQKIVEDPRLVHNVLARSAAAWVHGWIELHQGDNISAARSFQKVLDLSDVISDKFMSALARRCLGEIAFLADDHVEAAAQFKRARSICSSMDALPAFVFDCNWAYMKLDDRFQGWKAFSECKHPFNKEEF